MKIRTKLFSILLIISVIAGLIGYVGFENTNRVFQILDVITEDTSPELILLGDIKFLSQKLVSYTLNHMLVSNFNTIPDMEEYEIFERTNSELDQVIFTLEEHEKNDDDFLQEEEEEFVEEVKILKSKLYSNSLRLIDISNKNPDSQEIISQVQELKDTEDEIQMLIDERLSQEKQELSNIGEIGSELFQNTTMMILLITMGGIVFVLVLSTFISRSITEPLRKLVNASNKIREGNLNEKITPHGTDESKKLMESFNHMTDGLKKNIALEKELARSNEKLKNEKLTTIGLVSARLSHDLRNPLTVIKSTIQIHQLKNKDSMTDEDKKRFDRVDDAINSMVHQIEGVLAFVQNKPLDLETTSISLVLERAVNMIEVPPTVKIILPEKDMKINCDSKKLEVVFYNLMVNAIQAMNEKGTITIRIKQKNNQIVIEFEDSGPGVPQEMLSQIFDPLFTTKNLGTGLGLSSCMGIAKQHGGTITVQTSPSIFSVIFPMDIMSELDVMEKNNAENT